MRRQQVFETLKSAWKRPVGMLAVLSMVVLLTAPAGAQLAGKGAVTGTVTDTSGAAIPGATVVVTNDATGVAATTKASGEGLYSLPTLDPGIYTVTVTATGFQKLEQKNVHVNALESQTFSPKMEVGTETQTVTVTSEPPQLETSNATLGATMEQEMYSALPIEMGAYGQADQRRATDVAFLMPGVQGNNTNGNATTNTGVVNGSGNRGAVSAVYIDGVAFVRAGGNGDPRYVWTAISVDAVDQFQVQTAGYSAIYEGQGIQNYTVKQGGQKYHGSIYEFFRNTALDSYGFYPPTDPLTGAVKKPVEHSNEFGINLSGPLVPFGGWREKLFLFGNYNGFRFTNQKPVFNTFPTLAQQAGNFQGLVSGGIFDPFTQTACTANSTDGPCRYRYGYVYGGAPGPRGNPTLGPQGAAGVDIIPASEFSAIALKMQANIPALTNQLAQNNYLAPNKSGLTNWSTTERIDWHVTDKNTVTLLGAVGRQASSNPVGQTTVGRNVGPIPYNFGQTYAPKTAVGIVEDTHVFSARLINQFKYGYARYDGPTFDADQVPAYAATAMGITNLPVGAAQQAFPITSFSGTNAPTGWAGAGPNRTIAENYTLVDNVQYTLGAHSITAGAQIAWMLYQNIPAPGSTTPLTIANSVTETGNFTASSNAKPTYTLASNTGLSYASFLIGQIDRGTLTQYAVQEFGARFRAISPYVQDNWKVNSKLTLDLGVRWDYFPSYNEVHDNMSYFDPNATNPVTNLPGALVYTGKGPGTCNCRTPVNNYLKNIGPRLGLAYQVDPATVIRASYGVMFTHGGAVGGGNGSSLGTGVLGFSAAPSFTATGQGLTTFPLYGTNTAFPSYAQAQGRASGAGYGTGFTTVAGFTGAPQGMGYADTYLGGRAPEYINWSLGFQHQWTSAFTSTMTYVGSQGHFLASDGSNARGYWANQLDPKYLSLGSNLSLTGTALAAFCAANAGVCPAGAGIFNTSQSLATLLRPFPFQGVSDTFGQVANANYHALQTTLNMRANHGLTFMANYTWSRTIDDTGTFRSGYAIPATYTNNGRAYAADRIERTVAQTNQPHHVSVTGVWELPFGKTIASGSEWERAVLGGFKLSTIYQAYSGSPLVITGASCNANPAAAVCFPSYNPAYSPNQNVRINGKWGAGTLSRGTGNPKYIDANAFVYAPAYTFGNLPRTAPYNLYGPGNYQLDLALVRSFKLHLTDSARLNLRAEMYNVTNHTKFAVASTVFGNSNFGQVTADVNAPTQGRQVQLSGRLEF